MMLQGRCTQTAAWPLPWSHQHSAALQHCSTHDHLCCDGYFNQHSTWIEQILYIYLAICLSALPPCAPTLPFPRSRPWQYPRLCSNALFVRSIQPELYTRNIDGAVVSMLSLSYERKLLQQNSYQLWTENNYFILL